MKGTFISVGEELALLVNVHEFPGHIACDSASNAESVIPGKSTFAAGSENF